MAEHDPYAGLGTPAGDDPYAGLGTPVSDGGSSPIPPAQAQPQTENSGLLSMLPDSVAMGIRNARRDIADLYSGLQEPSLGVRMPIPSPDEALRIIKGDDRLPPPPVMTDAAPDWHNRSLPMDERVRLLQEERLRNQKTWDEENAFREGRTPLRRAEDTAAFVASMPVRGATQGEYGLGDILPAGGESVRQAEAGFVRANPGELRIVQRLGEAAMSHPYGLIPPSNAGSDALFAKERGQALRRALDRSAKRSALTDARLEDLDAFHRSGVRPFGPAFTDVGTAGTVKQLSEAPIVGAPVRDALEEALSQTRDRGEEIASLMGDARTYRDVGNVVRQGLERYADAKSSDIIGDTARNLSDEELANIIAQEARNTSVKTRQDAMYERAWRDIPKDMQSGRSRRDMDRFFGGFSNTRKLFIDMAQRNSNLYSATRGGVPVDPSLSYPVRGGIAGRIVQDIIDGRWRGNLQSMRDVRSTFRRMASSVGDTEANTLQLSDYKRIQSAMTQDMIDLLQRNADYYTGVGDTDTAARVLRAIQRFRDADAFTRESMEHMESLEKLYNAQSPESLALNIWRDAQGGRKGGNFDRLISLKRALRDDEWGDVAAGVFREMGRPVASSRGMTQDLGFSIGSFLTNFNSMSPEGRRALFSMRNGAGAGNLEQALTDFARVATRMGNFEALTNTSRSATNALGMSGLASIFLGAQQALMGHPGAAAGAASVAAGMYGVGKFLTSPIYVRWLTRAVRLSREPRAAFTLRDHARELAALAAKDPDPELKAAAKAIAFSAGKTAEKLASGQNTDTTSP